MRTPLRPRVAVLAAVAGLAGAVASSGCYGEVGGCTQTSFDVIDGLELTEAEAAAAPIPIGHLRSDGEGIPLVSTPAYIADPDAHDESSRELSPVGTDENGAILLDLADEIDEDIWQSPIFLETTLRIHFQPISATRGVDYCWASAEIPIHIIRDPNRPPPGTPQVVPELPQATQP